MKRTRHVLRHLADRRDGFTLVELSIVVVLATLVAAMAFLAITFVQHGLTRWEARMHLGQEVQRWHRALTLDVRRADGIRAETDGYTLDGPSGRVAYRVGADGRWYRNGTPLHAAGIDGWMDIVPSKPDGTSPFTRSATLLVELRTTHAHAVQGTTVRLAPIPRWAAPPTRAAP